MEKFSKFVAKFMSNDFLRTFTLEILKVLAARTKNTYDDDLVKALEATVEKEKK